MSHSRGLRPLSVALLLILVLMLAPGSAAQSKYNTLHKFTLNGDGGSEPSAGLIFDQAGNLYGTADGGGAHGRGTVFKLTLNADGSWTEGALYSFCSLSDCRDGAAPSAGLIFDRAGNLYGTTYSGGADGRGVIFELTNADGTWTQSVLHDFSDGDGANPSAVLIFDHAGNLYGTTLSGGAYENGVVFQLTPNSDGSWKEKLLHQFTGGWDGAIPSSGLIFDRTGNLYGTTEGGGNPSCIQYGCGVVFMLTPNSDGSWEENVLHHFSGGNDGADPRVGLIFDQAGNLYGTTNAGGNISYCSTNPGCGVVFELTTNPDGGWKERVLHRFTGGKDGAIPSGLIFDQAGNLYGTTYGGGNLSICVGLGCGVVFRVSAQSKGGWRETVLHTFFDHPGAWPSAGVIFGEAGRLYGTTSGDGGRTTFGSVFEITP